MTTNAINLTSQRISFVNKISILQKALSDDEVPTPSYLYKEINDISYESVGYCESLVEFLMDRLRHKSCHVKLKVLKVLKHVLDHGSQNFQLSVRQQVSTVKECTKFSGPPHPVHGNTPYLMVRNLAVELCEQLYNMDPLALKTLKKGGDLIQTPQSKYGGMGPSRSGGAIQGFGNTPVSQSKSIAGTILQEIEKLGTKLSETPADRQAALLARLDLSASSSNYQPPVISPDVSRMHSPESKEQSPVSCLGPTVEKPVKVIHHLPGKAGGGWNDDDDDDDEDEGEMKRTAFESQQSTTERDGSKAKEVIYSQASENPSEEQRLVEDLIGKVSVCSGRQDFLSNSEIANFLHKCSRLKGVAVLDCLCHHLCGDNPIFVTRSLQLLEGLIYSRHQLVNIDVLAARCRAELVECYSTASQSASELAKTDQIHCAKFKTAQTKAAKLILILQQLSSHKDIVSMSEMARQLSSSPESILQHKKEVISS